MKNGTHSSIRARRVDKIHVSKENRGYNSIEKQEIKHSTNKKRRRYLKCSQTN